MIHWKKGPIEGCRIEPLQMYEDRRGWLAEFFRHDELTDVLYPVMGYVSMTRPGQTRGPHEHRDQTDLFAFFHGTFRLYLWDARSGSATHGHRQMMDVGAARPVRVIVPPGVVHAYRNIGADDALIVNAPNQLYAGQGKCEPVDEIRHEDRDDGRFATD